MNDEEYFSLQKQLPELRRQLVDIAFGRIPKSIPYLNSVLERATSLEDRIVVYGLLLCECKHPRDDKANVYFMRKQLQEMANYPFAYTQLSTMLAHEPDTQDEALKIASQGVKVAKHQNRMVKYALTCQARIALEIGNYNIFNETLLQLIEDADVQREEDYRLEFDFLDHADNSQVDEPILNFVCRGHIMLTKGAMNDRNNEEAAQAQTHWPVFQRAA